MPAGSDDAQRARAEARADLIRRLFAVAISVGFAATLARMTWVQNGTLPNPAELNQTLILGTALLAAILGWDGHLVAMSEKPLFGFWRFQASDQARHNAFVFDRSIVSGLGSDHFSLAEGWDKSIFQHLDGVKALNSEMMRAISDQLHHPDTDSAILHSINSSDSARFQVDWR